MGGWGGDIIIIITYHMINKHKTWTWMGWPPSPVSSALQRPSIHYSLVEIQWIIINTKHEIYYVLRQSARQTVENRCILYNIIILTRGRSTRVHLFFALFVLLSYSSRIPIWSLTKNICNNLFSLKSSFQIFFPNIF